MRKLLLTAAVIFSAIPALFAQVPQAEGDRLDGAGQDCSKHKAQNETKNGVKNNESFLHAEASAEYAVE